MRTRGTRPHNLTSKQKPSKKMVFNTLFDAPQLVCFLLPKSLGKLQLGKNFIQGGDGKGQCQGFTHLDKEDSHRPVLFAKGVGEASGTGDRCPMPHRAGRYFLQSTLDIDILNQKIPAFTGTLVTSHLS